MVRRLLRDVEGLGAGSGLKVPVAGEPFAEDGVEGLLDAAMQVLERDGLAGGVEETDTGLICQPLK